jgi:hypothetical protein
VIPVAFVVLIRASNTIPLFSRQLVTSRQLIRTGGINGSQNQNSLQTETVMKSRILIAAMALVFGFSNLARAGKEEFIHLGHKLKAEFPMVSKHVQKKVDTDLGEATNDMFVSGCDGKAYMLMVTEVEGKKFLPPQLSEFMNGLVPALEGTYKNAKLVKESELELNKNCPGGRCYLVQHDAGMLVLWATVANGKVYVAWVSGPTKKDLGSDVEKEFLNSIEIEKK